MEMQIIQSAASEALVNITLAAITLVAAIAVYYIRLASANVKAQTSRIQDEAARELLDNALDDVERLATKAVGAMEQTTAKALREAVKGGSKSRDELLALGRDVFNDVKSSIGPEAQKVITDNLGSFDKYLTKCIENAVLKVKQADPYLTIDEGVVVEGVAVSER